MEEKKEEKSAENTPMKKEEGKENFQYPNESCRRKIKNYISIVILLVGLLVGSVFVDVAQFFGRQGVSPKILKSVDVFPFEGKTWVAYKEPVINLQVLTDRKCEACDPTEPLKWLKRIIPTTLAKKVEIDSKEGTTLSEKFNIKSIPAFIFDENIIKTDIYEQAQEIFEKRDGNYLMNTEQVGIKVGKYLKTPDVSEDDLQVGSRDAKVKVILFSDFQCPYCKSFFENYKKAINDYKDQTLFVFKHIPLNFHKQAQNAAMVAECANEQGKFWQMADKLYATQTDWQNTEGLAKFKTYASALELNAVKFNECLDEKKYQDKIDADIEEAQLYGISGTPSFFVNDQFFSGLISYDELKKTIDKELEK